MEPDILERGIEGQRRGEKGEEKGETEEMGRGEDKSTTGQGGGIK